MPQYITSARDFAVQQYTVQYSAHSFFPKNIHRYTLVQTAREYPHSYHEEIGERTEQPHHLPVHVAGHLGSLGGASVYLPQVSVRGFGPRAPPLLRVEACNDGEEAVVVVYDGDGDREVGSFIICIVAEYGKV